MSMQAFNFTSKRRSPPVELELELPESHQTPKAKAAPGSRVVVPFLAVVFDVLLQPALLGTIIHGITIHTPPDPLATRSNRRSNSKALLPPIPPGAWPPIRHLPQFISAAKAHRLHLLVEQWICEHVKEEGLVRVRVAGVEVVHVGKDEAVKTFGLEVPQHAERDVLHYIHDSRAVIQRAPTWSIQLNAIISHSEQDAASVLAPTSQSAR
ncbi:hypothetical protein IWZ03DRAFT_356327 [Phyllosticta citriasiana]|uniref:Uncharacterized protein n=1 Tax=Phyllosticta citriasiana TaxID=595635 RepID=A0ABR1L0A0_9PEZI